MRSLSEHVLVQREFTFYLLHFLRLFTLQHDLVQILSLSLLPLHTVKVNLVRIVFVFGQPVAHIDIEDQIGVVQVRIGSSRALI